MEQVFELVNTIVDRDRETRKRDLRIRVYKVIPLASQAGVLEFVVNTCPLSAWLTPAHPRSVQLTSAQEYGYDRLTVVISRRYRPGDISADVITKGMKAQQRQRKRDPGTTTTLFLKWRESFQPVMRYFFREKHKQPMAWFAMRLNYTRSVATTSIVGHILGLGDRHTSNILLDTATGEAVHIDLGISFEQVRRT